MKNRLIALFGESQKGALATPCVIESVQKLQTLFGEPTSQDSYGIFFAIQFLLQGNRVLYVRVEEEGFCIKDYIEGIKKLEPFNITEVCLPGVGDPKILQFLHKKKKKIPLLLVRGEDWYDYMTCV